MQFVADSELIFKVCVAGKWKLVCFSERGSNGVSIFTTKDPILAQAIRNTRFFKSGRIEEDLSKADDMYYDTVSEKPSVATPGTEQPEGETPGIVTTGADAPSTEQEVKKFSSITFAKNYLAKEFGIDKKTLKTPAQVKAAAEAQGVQIDF